MAGMDLKMRRNDRGMSVFWMILVCGVAVVVLLAVMLAVAGGGADQAEEGDAPLVIVGEEEEPGSASFDQGETAVDGPTQAGELDGGGPIEPAVEPTPEGEAQITAEPEVEAGGAGGAEVELDPAIADDPGDVVVDEAVTRDPPRATEPDPNRPAVVTTPSGPEGRDDETILGDEPNPAGEMDVGKEVE